MNTRHVSKLTAIAAAAMLWNTAGSFAFADLEAAKKAIADAKQNVTDSAWGDADTNLKLAEAELDGVPDADKTPVMKQIELMKKQVADAQGNVAKAGVTKQVTDLMSDAKGYLMNDPDAVVRDSDQLDELLKTDDVKSALSADEIAKYQKQMATYRKVAQGKLVESQAAQLSQEVQRLQSEFDDTMKLIKQDASAHSSEVDVLSRDLEITGKHLAAMPADNAKIKEMQGRYDKMNSTFTIVALAGQAKQKLETLKNSWESYADEYKGWEAEKTGVTFDQYKSQQSEKMSAFNAPQTKGLISRSSNFLKNLETDSDYKQVAAAPDLKAFIDSIKSDHDTAYAKMLGFIKPVIADASKAPLTNDSNKSAVDRLKDDVRLALGEDSDDTKAFQSQLDKQLTGAANAAAAGDDAKGAAYKQMTEAAAKSWPDMLARYSPEEGFDPSNLGAWKGKTIKITSDNLMGYRFGPGDFPFATTVNGQPVAGKFDAKVAAAVKDVEAKMGRQLGDSDDDGKWEIIATVTGSTGKLSARKQVEGKIKDDQGNEATVTGERHDTVDAPIITIIAARCGPLAVSTK